MATNVTRTRSICLAAGLVVQLLGQTAPLAQTTSANADLIASAKLGEVARVTELLAKGAAVNTSDRRGMTPLMWASASGNVEVVQQLLDRGAIVDRRAADGSTALMLASANGFTEIVRALLVPWSGRDCSKGRRQGASTGIRSRLYRRRRAARSRRDSGRAAVDGRGRGQRHRGPPAARDRRTGQYDQREGRDGPHDGGAQRRPGDAPGSLVERRGRVHPRQSGARRPFEWAEPSPTTAKYVIAFLADRGISREAARPSGPAQSPQVRASLRTLAGVLQRVPPASAPVREAQRRANTALSQLEQLSAKWPAESPDDYRDNLAGDIAALEAALRSGNVDNLGAALQSLAEDLEIKLEHCTWSGGRLGGSIVVRVRTLQGAEERKSWQVFYMPRIFEAAGNASPDSVSAVEQPD